jgi:transcription initiation factor TFIID subunit 11
LLIILQLINQTLSQSVPGTVILAVKSVTKIFAGEIIERARKVQGQWIEASDESQTGLQSPPGSDNDEISKERRRGPLTADHLREALRRYKLERDHGLVGVLGLGRLQHSSGCERYAIRAMGKRLFK